MNVTELKFLDRDIKVQRTVTPYKNGCRRRQCCRWETIVVSLNVGYSWDELTILELKILL